MNPTHLRTCRCSIVGMLLLTFGCLEPLTDDVPGYSHHVLPADAVVSELADDELLAKRVAAHDGLSSAEVSIRTGYAAGAEVRFWDLGEASSTVKPMWLFRRRDANDMPEAFGHLDLVDTLPGDTGHTPFRTRLVVFVTDRYAGERITSVEALEDAMEMGLVEEPVALDTYGNYPATRADATLELADGTWVTPDPVYYRGLIATHFDLNTIAGITSSGALARNRVPASRAYSLRRQHEDRPLDEALWGVDLNGNGRTLDSQIIFATERDSDAYTPLFSLVRVTVPSDYAWGGSQSEADLFTRESWGQTANPEIIIGYEETTILLNQPHVGQSR